LKTRKELLAITHKDILWDVVVIGGGASGLGAALDAVSRGYKTLLVEQYDFAKGTSSRSTKLAHGGVRYLAQGNVRLVFEALRERGLMQKNAPHLFSNISFMIPAYTWWAIPFYTIGLTIYDLMAGRKSFGSSKPQTKSKVIKKLPTIIQKNLKGGILYHDGQFDDARLAINLAQTIVRQNGVALNYVKAVSFEKLKNKISGVKLQDTETGEEFVVKTKAVVNATGVFVNDILQLDNPKARDIVQASQGVHIVLDKEFLPSKHGLMIPKTRDGRVLFAVPWSNKVIIGTTDVPKEKHVIEPKATDEEIDFILETAGRFLIKKPTRDDIKSVFAGLRPLAAPKEGKTKTKEISRGHKIYTSESGLVTIIGGKWTTYRQMGEDVIDKVIKTVQLTAKASLTKDLKIHGYQQLGDTSILSIYGVDAIGINILIAKKPNLRTPLSINSKILKAQVVWACQKEWARTIEDVLARRTRLLFLDAKESIKVAPQVAEIMANELGYDTIWQEKQLHLFEKLAQNYLSK
jgi:glycerol-3-phosphate dehydrogenase